MRCILIAGIESSGTSTVAGVLHHLGVYMGSKLRSPSKANVKGYYEDWTFLHIIGVHSWSNKEIRDPKARVRKWLEGRLEENKDLWGLKYNEPLLNTKFDVIEELQKLSIDVRFIIVKRPFEAIARSIALKRRKQPTDTEVWSKIPSKEAFLRRHIAELKQTDIPLLEISYDRVVDFPAIETEKLIEFCFEDLPRPEESQIETALSFIEPKLRHWRKGTTHYDGTSTF